jgi:hypothetical protein
MDFMASNRVNPGKCEKKMSRGGSLRIWIEESIFTPYQV